MGIALYRKYRSKSLSEIVGQEHVTQTLDRAIKAGKISHAYLLTGPRGVGKTSIARIIAHEVNGLPYTDESVHLDIIEIDAASNRRIDEIRDLRDKVHIAPTSAKYKVYIIDEVHMLTKEAFNALLKTLEEPPAHVIFILATTEAHKLPETIVSRTQRFTFKAIDQPTAVEHLKEIAKKEKMNIDDSALELLAEHGRGSFRDAIGMLDQVGNSKDSVSRKDVEMLIGIASAESITVLLNATVSGEPKAIVESLDTFIEQGIAPAQVAKQLAALVREQLLLNNLSFTHVQATDLLATLLSVPVSPDPYTALELALFQAAPQLNTTKNTRSEPASPTKPSAAAKQSASVTKFSVSKIDESNIKEVQEIQMPKAFKNAQDVSAWWPDLITVIKKHNNTLYGVLRMAHPEYDGEHLSLSFAFGLHTKKIADAQINMKLRDEIKLLTGQDVIIDALHNKALKGIAPVLTGYVSETPNLIEDVRETTPETGLRAITSIFGGGEVLER